MSRIPTHFSDEKNKGLIIMACGGFGSLFLLLHFIQFAPILAYLGLTDFNAETWVTVRKFFGGYYNPVKFVAGMKYVWALDPTYTVVATIVTIVLSAVPIAIAAAMNPFRMYDLIHGDARRGTRRDIREMEDRKQVGIIGGNYLTLGEWPATKEPVRLIETLSVLVLAPPGTGKCLRKDVLVLRFGEDGYHQAVPVGSIKIGDNLVNPRGEPTVVTEVNDAVEEMFAVRTSGDDEWYANGDHILPLRKANAVDRHFLNIREYMGLTAAERQDLLMRRSMIETNESDIQTSYNHCPSLLGEMISSDPAGVWKERWLMQSFRDRQQIILGVLPLERTTGRPSQKGPWLINDVAPEVAPWFTMMAQSVGFSATKGTGGTVRLQVPTALRSLNVSDANRLLVGSQVTLDHVKALKPGLEVYLVFEIDTHLPAERRGISLKQDNREFLLANFTVTHNTASFVVPSILETDDSSFIVNDPKPELFDLTSGWRREVGHVFKIDWSATDDTRDPDPQKWLFYPRFNVLSPKLLPPAGSAERDTYLDAIANVLSPGGGGGKNDYFEQKGRAALVGFLHYLCSKIVDAGNFDGLPSKWKDAQEPCIPMMIDLVNEGLRRASDENDAKKEEASKTGGFHQGDALSDWLKAIVKECMDFGYNPRAATEITPLVSMAPNERSGILGTMDKAFLPFKNAAVQERTTSCDFVPADLRGMIDPTDGEMKPVTLYMCVNQSEAAAFATITSLVYEVLSREFLAYGPKETNKKGVTLGPYPVCFMLDEFAKLPKIEAVMTGPDLGRSKKTYYCLIAQSDSQIGKIYSKEDQQIIYATTAVKYILPQNDEGTISLIQKMVGSTTIKRSSFSKSRGADMKEWGKSNESVALEKVDFIRPGDISAMKNGTHMLICQGFMSRPYTLKSKMFFKYPDLLAKAYNPRTNLGPKPANPLPDFVRERRIAEVLAQRQTPTATLYSNPYEEAPLDLDKGVDLGKRAA